MRAVLTAHDLATALRHVLPGVTFGPARTEAALSPDLFATAEALRRVQDGTPFRDAYRAVGTNLDALTAPSAAEALRAYVTPGTPGQVQTEELSAALEAVRGRF